MLDVMVSIIIPSYNRALFVSETLDSVISQTYQNWECIVVDDGSTDETKAIVKRYVELDERVMLYDRNIEMRPKGACACRNQGADLSVGRYLVFLDTDDLLEPFCLEQRVKVMEGNVGLDFSIFPSLMFRETPNDLGLWWNIDKDTDELIRQFHQDAICQTTGVIWEKSSFNRLGQWDESLHLWQDIDLFFRAFIQNYKYKKFFELPPDLHNRRLETSLSRSNFFTFKKMESRIKVIKQVVNLLNRNNKKKYLIEARYMVAEIVSGLVRVKNYKKALSLIKWGLVESVFNINEAKKLRLMVFFHKTRLIKLSFFSRKNQDVENFFRVSDCTLGVVPHKPVNLN